MSVALLEKPYRYFYGNGKAGSRSGREMVREY
jgi:hypothetical protein